MTLPASLRINAQFPFPSLVQQSGPITITKTAGIWTVGFNISNLTPVPNNTPAGNTILLVWNTLTNTFQQMPVSALPGLLRSSRIVTTTGNVPVTLTDLILLMNPAVPAPCNIQLPAALTRAGVPLSVKDLLGFCAANNISITPNGTETIDGVNAAFVMNDNFEAVTLNPLAAGGGWWIG